MKPVLLIDLDGTLLGSDLRISQQNIDALQTAARSGAEIVFSTGRPLASAKRLAVQFPSIRYLISSNGGCLADLKLSSAECVASFSDQEVDTVLEFAAGHGLRPILYTVDNIWADALTAEVYLEISRSGAKPHIVTQLPRNDIIKALLIGRPPTVKSGFNAIADNSQLSNVFAYVSYPEYLEMSPKGAGKVAASELLLKKLGLGWKDTISFGDNTNDVEMMRCSAISVAVGNATPEAKAVATVIAPTNDESGVAVAINWLLFKDMNAKSKLQIFDPVFLSNRSKNPS